MGCSSEKTPGGERVKVVKRTLADGTVREYRYKARVTKQSVRLQHEIPVTGLLRPFIHSS